MKIFHITCGYPKRTQMLVLEAESLANDLCFIALPNYWNRPHIFKEEKLEILSNYISAGMLQDEDIVLFTDAYDVSIVGHRVQFFQRFMRSGKDIIFSAEANFWPAGDERAHIKSHFEVCKSKWRFLNSGCYIGYVWAIREMLQFCKSHFGRDDQAVIQEFYCEHIGERKISVGLDTSPTFFASLNGSTDDFVLKSWGVCPKGEDTPVLALHANGNKENVEVLAKIARVLKKIDDRSLKPFHLMCVDRGFAYYDRDSRKIKSSNNVSDLTLVVEFEKGRALTARTCGGERLTFLHDGHVNSGARHIGDWEKLAFDFPFETCHKLPFMAYCDDISQCHLEGVPLSAIDILLL